MKPGFLSWVSVISCCLVFLYGCHETPSKVINEERDPTIDSFSLVTPTNLRASLGINRNTVTLRWENSEPENPNRYQIRIISVDQQMNESDTVVQVSSPMPTGRFRLQWTDTDMDSFQKRYSIRSQYEFESDAESKFSEWTDTVTVNLFEFNAEVRYWRDYAYITMSYVIPNEIPFSYAIERIEGDDIIPFKDGSLSHSASELEIRDQPRIVGENEFSYRLRLTTGGKDQEWIYLDTLRMDSAVVGPPDNIRITDEGILRVDHSENKNSSHRVYVDLNDCESNPIRLYDSNRSIFLTLDLIDECFPVSVSVFSEYRMFQSNRRNFILRKDFLDRKPEYARSYYPNQDKDIELYDLRSSDGGEFMIAIGKSYNDQKYIRTEWSGDENLYDVHRSLNNRVAEVIGYDGQNPKGYYLMTTEDFLRFENGIKRDVKSHSFTENFSDIDWFYPSPNNQLLMLAQNGELAYYDYLTLQPKNRASVSYEKIRHLWDDLVLLQNNESVNVMNAITGETILSWPQSMILWYTDHKQAALLMADGTIQWFQRDDYKPDFYSLPAQVNRFTIKSILPISKDALLMSVIENDNTRLLYYNSGTDYFSELQEWEFGMYGYHVGWILDDRPSIYLGFEQAEFDYITNSNYTIEEID